MNKQEFLEDVRIRLSALPKQELEERLSFYAEMIDDRVEEGLSEEEAVNEVKAFDDLFVEEKESVPQSTPEQKRGVKWWVILLLALGSPIWLSLLIAAVSVIIACYAVLFAAVVSLWAVFAALVGCGIGGIVSGIGFAFFGGKLAGVALLGMGLICAGLSIFMIYGCSAASKGFRFLAKLPFRLIKKALTKKEGAR